MTTHAQLKAFHAVALERNFHRAAERLHLTQPAISIQVRNLERDSAVTLFRRNGHTIELTEEGRALFDRTTRMFTAETEALGLLRRDRTRHTPTIHLGADGPHVVLDLITALNAATSNVHFRVTMANAAQTWNNLIDLRVDAAVMANPKPDKRVTSHGLCVQDLCVLVNKNHALSVRGKVDIGEVAQSPLIFREAGSNTQQIVDNAFADRDYHVTPALVLGSRETVIEAVARNLGVGFLFSREAQGDPRCIGIPIEGLEKSNRDMLLYLKDNRRNPLIKALATAAKALGT